MGAVVLTVRRHVSACPGRVDILDGGAGPLYDRKAIGWAFSAGLETAPTAIPALRTAFASRAAREDLLDRGAQYCAQSFRALLQEYCPAILQSMR